MYTDDQIAQLYDVQGGWAQSDEFYLAFAIDSDSVLDVGCGTGMLLHRARQAGHLGRLVGLDPDPAMLTIARRYPTIEWVAGTAATIPWEHAFELALMMGHAFQVLTTEDEIRDSLAAIHRALVPGGVFVFETRNPLARAWEGWNPANAAEFDAPWGERVRVTHHVLSVENSVVTMTETTSSVDGAASRIDHGRLGFFDIDVVNAALAAAGFAIDAQHGYWDRSPYTPDSPEIITIAHRVA